ncbi:MAG TPA: neutral/alkaline non-lysosomal ceramidase N-terminal domain-containing protein [Bryobacteraceae bacterium]|nr:neutral/alkaline non-lysosomal ceramidase N-terminal domain-containing protein [Bryobacteraceae bacterium]
MIALRFFAIGLAVSLELFGAGFRAAAVRVDITPQTPQWLMGYAARRSTGVQDRIYHRVVAMDSGDRQFYLIASDLCLFSPALYEDVVRQLQKEDGIDPQQLWWSVTHTHSAPEVGEPGMYRALLGRSDHEWDREYTGDVAKALIGAVRSARSRLEPARIAFAEGLSMANLNRRAKDPEGRVSLGLNPDGPVDRQIGVIRIESAGGSPIALIANYAMHGTVLSGQNLLISGDAPGSVTAYLENKLGGTVLFVNGAAGNIAPIYSVYPDPRSGHLSQFNVLLGDRILAAVGSMGTATAEVAIWTGEKIVDTPRKEGLAWPESLPNYAKTEGRAMVRLPVRFLRINDTLIWSAPVELFCEIAMRVRGRSPFSHTFYFGYTNGWLGYLPTAKAFEEGGYEPATSPFTPRAEADVENAVVAFLQGMTR